MSSNGDSFSPAPQPNTKRRNPEEEETSPTSNQRQKIAKGNEMVNESKESNAVTSLLDKVERLENQIIEQREYIDKLLDRVNILEKDKSMNEFPTLVNTRKETTHIGNYHETAKNNVVNVEENQRDKEINCSWGKGVKDFLNLKQRTTGNISKIELTNEIKKKTYKNNATIIAFNVPESNEEKKEDNWKNDEKKMVDILKSISIDENKIVKTFRFKKMETNKIPPVKVILKDEQTKTDILKKASGLRNTEFNRIWLKPELKQDEVKRLKDIRDKQNEIMREQYKDKLKCVIVGTNKLRIVVSEKDKKQEDKKEETKKQSEVVSSTKQDDNDDIDTSLISNEDEEDKTQTQNIEDGTQKLKKTRGRKSYDTILSENKKLLKEVEGLKKKLDEQNKIE